VKQADKTATTLPNEDAFTANERSPVPAQIDDSETNKEPTASSNDDITEKASDDERLAASSQQRSKPQPKPLPTPSKVIHGETRGLYPQIISDPPFPKAGMYESRNWDTHSFMELQRARADMAKVVDNRNQTKMVEGVKQAGPPGSNADDATRRAWELGEQANNYHRTFRQTLDISIFVGPIRN
jgi:hypothetical protein